VPGPIKFQQLQLYMKAKDSGCAQTTAAAKAGISVRTARRIDKGEHCPQRGRPRDWRTRPDPLAQVWASELQPMLEQEPRLEPMTLFEYLQEQYPGCYDSQLRTLQRRVEQWKAAHGKPKEVMFQIRNSPGEMGLSDFTQLKGVTITINGHPFTHLLYHYRLAYSGWQYVQVIQGGESFVGLSNGLQNALAACGGVPCTHRTDSLSAAYRNTGGRNPKLTRMYEEVCAHYRVQPTRNNLGVAHENGAVEASHGHFKRRLCQALYRRGSFDFSSVAAYQAFIEQVIEKLNAKHTQKFVEERPYLQPLPRYRYPDYEVLSARVSCHSTLSVRCILYTVPSRLVGQRLTLHLYHDHIVGFIGTTQVLQLPRVHVPGTEKIRRTRCVNYRHVIDSLRRKPRAFLYCQWQQELLPNDEWRVLWQQMKETFEPDRAARLIVEGLYLAATHDKEAALAAFMQVQLQQGTLTLSGLQQQFSLLPNSSMLSSIQSVQHGLSSYDQLLSSVSVEPLSEPEPSAQTPQAQPLPCRVDSHRTEGNSRALVLCSVPPSPSRGRSQSPRPSSHHSRAERGALALRKILEQL
jgi:hypothetical protein